MTPSQQQAAKQQAGGVTANFIKGGAHVQLAMAPLVK